MAGIKPVMREIRDAVLHALEQLKNKLHRVLDNAADNTHTTQNGIHGVDHYDGAPDLTAGSRRPYQPQRGPDGNYVPGTLPSADELRVLRRTDPNTAYYWSGGDANGIGVGPDGSGAAESMAVTNGGQTLEQTLAANGVDPLAVWDETDPEATRFWEEASAAFAENACGDVHAVVGSDLREGNIRQTVEIPRLLDNPNVTSITEINVDTGIANRVS